MAGSGITAYQAYDEAVAATTCDWLHARHAASAGDEADRPFAAVYFAVLPTKTL